MELAITDRYRYHKVSQTCSAEGICVAVNYWYDMEFTGSLWSAGSYFRNTAIAAMARKGDDDGLSAA